ncbi:MAG: electron transfer flavoprotein subunit alpha/FixB family protein, partial [Pseudomonadales bacterium]
MSVLVIAEHENGTLVGSTLNTISAALAIGGDVDLMVAGNDCQSAAQAAAQVVGVSRVRVADDSTLAGQLAENMADLVVSLASDYSHILAPATTFGKNFMPRASALLDVSQISDISAVISADTFERPIYAGNALAKV